LGFRVWTLIKLNPEPDRRYDEGSAVIELGKEQPVASMDQSSGEVRCRATREQRQSLSPENIRGRILDLGSDVCSKSLNNGSDYWKLAPRPAVSDEFVFKRSTFWASKSSKWARACFFWKRQATWPVTPSFHGIWIVGVGIQHTMGFARARADGAPVQVFRSLTPITGMVGLCAAKSQSIGWGRSFSKMQCVGQTI